MKISEAIVSSLKELNICVDETSYSFLDTTPELHDIILIGLGGSHAYGTNIETSDVDIRGVALHSAKDILLGRGFEQVCNEPTDTTIYSLKKLISLLTNCNPNVIEMLGLKPEHYLCMSTLGKELIDNYDMFLSNKCVGSFMGYANQQMYRLQQKSLVAMSDEEYNAHIVKTLNGMHDTLESQHNIHDVNVKLKDGKIVLDLSVEDYPAEDLASVLNSINTVIREYNKNSKRNEHALAHGKIAKHSMHLLRLYMMCEDLLLDGKIITYRENEHDLLMDIRNGKYLGEDGKPTKEFFDMVHDYESRLEHAKEHSVLPQQPNYRAIDDFLISVNYCVLCSNNTEKEKPYGFYTSTRR